MIDLDPSAAATPAPTEVGVEPFEEERVELGDGDIAESRLDDILAEPTVAIDRALFGVMDVEPRVEDVPERGIRGGWTAAGPRWPAAES